jgi:hypothetical protein
MNLSRRGFLGTLLVAPLVRAWTPFAPALDPPPVTIGAINAATFVFWRNRQATQPDTDRFTVFDVARYDYKLHAGTVTFTADELQHPRPLFPQ